MKGDYHIHTNYSDGVFSPEKIVDLALLTTKEISYIKRLYNFIKISKDNGKELIELLNSFFTKKYTGTCYDIEQLLTDLNVLEKYNVRPNYK